MSIHRSYGLCDNEMLIQENDFSDLEEESNNEYGYHNCQESEEVSDINIDFIDKESTPSHLP